MIRRALVVGLTGGIGSGKSTVAAEFERLGAVVIDTDAIAHALTRSGGAAMPALEAEFGKAVLATDGGLDRAVMRALVFADPALRRRLEAVLHPLIRVESDRAVEQALANPQVPYVILMVPLLVESGSYRARVDRIVVVDCREETQIARVVQRSGLPRPDVERIMASQATRAQRLAAADVVVDNEGDLTAMRAQVASIDRGFRLESSE